MMNAVKQIAQRIKEYVLHTPNYLCYSHWCGNAQGFCPTFDCELLHQLRNCSDRQWENAVKDFLNMYTDSSLQENVMNDLVQENNSYLIERIAEVAIDYLWHKRPIGYRKGDQHGKTDKKQR